MTKSTKDYDIFKMIDCNREKIDHAHVKYLAKSISSKNLLEFKPILVNEKMEVMDGQHRLLAAKELNIPIFYSVQNDISFKDMINLQTQKSWRAGDYVNAYAKNGYRDYQLLQEFSKENEIPISSAITLLIGKGSESFTLIKTGNFKYKADDESKKFLSYCKDIRSTILNHLGKHAYQTTAKFWRALVAVCKHPDYNHEKMMKNLNSMITRVGPRVNYDGYLQMFLGLHNFRNAYKLNFDDSEGEE